ncbi:PEP-CTERM sorting domain-containing protein [bacterium]|nr:PEP-CTERM sorting domain-containing protein [bacterium]MCP5462223.1 PEP-CTERM sorting domain-containing protein [bacterium]
MNRTLLLLQCICIGITTCASFTSSLMGNPIVIPDDATKVQEVHWDSQGNATLFGWKPKIGFQDTYSVDFTWDQQDLIIGINTNQGHKSTNTPLSYYTNFGYTYDLLRAIGGTPPAEWQSNGVPTTFTNEDAGLGILHTADFFIDLNQDGTWDKSIVLQDHQEYIVTEAHINSWGTQRLGTVYNHDYDDLAVGLYSVNSWLKPYDTTLIAGGGAENYDESAPKTIPVFTQYATNTGVQVSINVQVTQQPNYEDLYYKNYIETTGFKPFLRDGLGNIQYNASGSPLYQTTLSNDWQQYRQDMNDWYFDIYGIGWDIPDDIFIHYQETYAQYRWEITLSGANQSSDWNEFDFIFGTAVCGNDVITGSVSSPVPIPEPATFILLGLSIASFLKRKYKI